MATTVTTSFHLLISCPLLLHLTWIASMLVDPASRKLLIGNHWEDSEVLLQMYMQ